MEALAALRPVFDKRYGSLTAGNSSPITDGASAVLLMAEERARALGLEPLGYVRSYAYAALDPGSQLLQGPAYAAPLALDRAELTLQDMDLVEMHEAFAAQVLSNMKAFASPKFAHDELGRSAPLGEIDFDRFNVNGGSIAIGHPFGATGARVSMQLLYEMRRRGLESRPDDGLRRRGCGLRDGRRARVDSPRTTGGHRAPEARDHQRPGSARGQGSNHPRAALAAAHRGR